jgi:hypothetical protein
VNVPLRKRRVRRTARLSTIWLERAPKLATPVATKKRASAAVAVANDFETLEETHDGRGGWADHTIEPKEKHIQALGGGKDLRYREVSWLVKPNMACRV